MCPNSSEEKYTPAPGSASRPENCHQYLQLVPGHFLLGGTLAGLEGSKTSAGEKSDGGMVHAAAGTVMRARP
jgi:hypothetical protein